MVVYLFWWVIIILCAGNCFLCEEQQATLICDDCYKQFNSKTVMAYCNECYKMSHKSSRSNHTSRPCSTWDSKLDLLSVLCIETSHYVCFSRQERRWLFFDSMSNRVCKFIINASNKLFLKIFTLFKLMSIILCSKWRGELKKKE